MELGYRMRGALALVAQEVREAGLTEDAGVLRDLGELATRVDAVCALADRFLEKRFEGDERVGDASMVKIAYSRCLRAFADMGASVAELPARYREPMVYGDLTTSNWLADFMNSYAWTIAELPIHLFLKRALLSWELSGNEGYWTERTGRETLNASP